MNSKLIIGLAMSFLGGAAAGIAGTYIYMKKVYCDKRIEDGINEFILNRYDAATGEVKEDANMESEGEEHEGTIHSSTVPKYQTPVSERVPYNEFYDKKSPQDILAEKEHPLDSDEDDEDNKMLDGMDDNEREAYLAGLNASKEHEAYVKGEMDPVEVIEEDEYGINPEYDDDVLIYWLGDDILTNELEEVVFDQLKDTLWDVFTDEWLAAAEKDPEADSNRLYVRHHEFLKDYMILPDARAYYDSH